MSDPLQRPNRRGGRFVWLWLLLPALVVAGVWGYRTWVQPQGPSGPEFVTQPVTRGPLTVTVLATGNLSPTNQVEIGSELSGTVATVGVEENDPVKAGQELARLDRSRLEDKAEQSRAQVAAAEAGIAVARAGIEQAEASLVEAEADLKRVRELYGNGRLATRADLDKAEAARARAVASLASARARLQEAEAQHVTAQAQLRSDLTNLDKAIIRAPIDGVVLTRQVEPGQTVAASLQAPVLFTLAENLAAMQLEVNVDEADVGQVEEGQSARFSVDAYPNRRYPARITRVNFGSQVTDGVVSYLTTLTVDNSDLSLRPGMTASAEITAAERQDVLLIPNAALRFTPPPPENAQASPGLLTALVPTPPTRSTSSRAPGSGSGSGQRARQVYVLRDGAPAPIKVQVGLSDGKVSEVIKVQDGEALEPGMELIVDVVRDKKRR